MQQRAARVAAATPATGAGAPPSGTPDELSRLEAAIRRDD
jgi:hypothetical protein